MTQRHNSLHVALPAVVTVDMGFTCLVLKSGTVRAHTLSVYREFGRIPPSVPDDAVLQKIAEVRRIFEGAPETAGSREAYWHAINTLVLDALSSQAHLASKLAKDVRAAYLGPAQLTTSRMVMTMVRDLRRMGIRVVIASNGTTEEVLRSLQEFKIRDQFDGIYTSDGLGVRKPNPMFWQQILAQERDLMPTRPTGPVQIIHIGNSLFSDSGAAALPHSEACIVDREGRYVPHNSHVHLNAQFSPEYAHEVRRWIRTKRVRFMQTRQQLRDHVMRRIASIPRP